MEHDVKQHQTKLNCEQRSPIKYLKFRTKKKKNMGILSYLREHSHQEMLSHPILPSKKLLYQLYYTILQYTQHPKILFFFHFI